MALARGCQSLARDRLCAPQILCRHLELGNSPIIDKEIKRWYFSFNPAVERALNGPGAKRGFTFAPNFKVAYSITKKIDGGLEYYGALGPLSRFDPKSKQQHQIFPAIDLNVSPKWEFNFGVGIGMTPSTDHLIFKMIIGRRFTFGQKKTPATNSSPE